MNKQLETNDPWKDALERDLMRTLAAACNEAGMAEMPILLARRMLEFVRDRTSEKEHYYDRRTSGMSDSTYLCACGKEDTDRDRLLRHIEWQQLKLQARREA